MNETPEFPEMPFDGRRFFEAVRGWPHDHALKYLMVLWHYWNHAHCTGLENDDDYLRRLAECEMQCWAKVKGRIFDGEHFFVLQPDGRWHQKRCREFYQRELERLAKRQQQTASARFARWAGRTDSVTDSKQILSPAAAMINNQKALERVEKRVNDLRNQRPFDRGDKRIAELAELKTERKRLMDALGWKA